MAINKLVTTASLKELMDKIEEISEAIEDMAPSDTLSLDIITSKVLPTDVVNGRIVVIDDSVGCLYFNNKELSDITGLKESDIYIKYGEEKDSCITALIKNSIKNIQLYLVDFYKYTSGSFVNIKNNVYIGKDGKWDKVNDDVYIFVNGEYPISAISRTYSYSGTYTLSVVTDKSSPYYNNIYMYSKMDNSASYFVLATSSKIDITNYSKIIIKGKFNASNAGADITLGVSSAKIDTKFVVSNTVESNKGETEIVIDVSNLNGSYYFKIYSCNNLASAFTFDFYISEIRLSL